MFFSFVSCALIEELTTTPTPETTPKTTLETLPSISKSIVSTSISKPAILLTNDGENGEPSWSPDGTKIAFSSLREGNSDIYVMNADGSEQTNITMVYYKNNMVSAGRNSTKMRDGYNVYDGQPAWSPDGTQIAFASMRNWNVQLDGCGCNQIYIVNADGSKPVGGLRGSYPNWSPSGELLWVSQGKYHSHESRIYTRIDRKDVIISKWSSTSNDVAPSWSPDSKKIAFSGLADDNQEIYVVDLYLSIDLKLEVMKLNRLTNNIFYDSHPEWSPDGKKIVFETWRDGNSEIYVMNADGSNQTNITNHNADDRYPAWSPDGKKIAFVSNRSGNNQIYVMEVE